MCVPAPALVVLLDQVDALYPKRHKGSDGICGDASHRRRRSDHNEGNALDITHSPEHGVDAGRIAEEARRQMQLNPVGGRLTYVIWDQRIAGASTSWRWIRYHGPNPHKTHCHLSLKSTAREDRRRWTILSPGPT
jgi:hypothetical protein